MLFFCISVLHFSLHERALNKTIQKSSCLRQKRCSLLSKLRRWLLQTWKALAAKLLPLGLPSKMQGLLPLMNAYHWLKMFKDSAPYSEAFLNETDYIKPSRLSYDCTMSHSCLLGFLCQNLFQGAIFCGLKQWSFGVNIQRVTVTNRLSNCFMDLSVNPLSVFLAERPILPQPSHLGYLPSQAGGFLS